MSGRLSVILMRAKRARREQAEDIPERPGAKIIMRYCERCDLEYADAATRSRCRLCGGPLD